MNKYIKALVKVTDSLQYAEDFRNGKLYMNELRYFINCEKSEMGDPQEAIARRSQHNFRVADQQHKFLINYQDTSLFTSPVFCLYTICDSKFGNAEFVSINHKKMRAFGKHAVVVTDVTKFCEKLRDKSLEFSPVNYYPDSYRGGLYNAIYNKLDIFAYQKEFRICDPNITLIMNYDSRNSLIGKEGFVDADHSVIELGSMKEFTSEILNTDDLIFPQKVNCPLTISWNKQQFEDFMAFQNPFYKGELPDEATI